MGLLSFFTNNAPGINALAGGLNALDGLTGYSQNRALKKQFEYNSQLMDKQQDYSRENATTAYNRQIELTQMNPLLQTVGMRQAGHNTAMGSGFTAVASVDSAASPSNPSVNAPDYQQGQRFADGINQLLTSGFDFANKKHESEIIKANADKAKADASIAQSDAAVREKYNELTLHRLGNDNTLGDYEVDFTKKYGDRNRSAETTKLESEANSAASRSFMDHFDAATHYERTRTELDIMKENLNKLVNDNSLHPFVRQQLASQLRLLEQQIRIATENADLQEQTHDLRVTRNNIDNYPFKFTDQFINRDLLKQKLSKFRPAQIDYDSVETIYMFYRQLGMNDSDILEFFNPGGWIGKASKETLKGASELVKQIRKFFK